MASAEPERPAGRRDDEPLREEDILPPELADPEGHARPRRRNTRAKVAGGEDPFSPPTTSSTKRQAPVQLANLDSAARRAAAGPGGTIAGLILGAFAYFAGASLVRGGPAGLRNWLRSKFLNITPGAASSAPASTTGVAAPAVPSLIVPPPTTPAPPKVA